MGWRGRKHLFFWARHKGVWGFDWSKASKIPPQVVWFCDAERERANFQEKTFGAGDEIRTHDIFVGNEVLYH